MFSSNLAECCFKMKCKDDKKPQNVILFKTETLQKCQSISRVRKQNNLAYSTTCLPEAPNETQGYHRICYQFFVALSEKQRKLMNENLNTLYTACDSANQELTDNIVDKKDNDRYLTRSAITSPKPSTTTGIFPIIYLICRAKNKKVNGQLQKLISASSDEIQDNISDAAKLLDDRKLLTRITNVSFSSKEVKYHNVCRLQYIRNASKLETNKVKDQTNCSDWHIARTSHNKSFDSLKEICH